MSFIICLKILPVKIQLLAKGTQGQFYENINTCDKQIL